MSGGLKEELGLEDPKPTETSAQKDEFKQKFQAAIGPMNENLQYTAAHAQQVKHDSFASKKEVSYKAYQAALAQIDPTNPEVAKDAIDQVMSAIEKLGAAIAEFKQAAEKAFEAWTARQGEVDKQAEKIREMVDWGHPKANALQGVGNAIKTKADERSYDEALSALDQMIEKMGPIIEDYERQKAAQQEYDPALQALQPRLDAAGGCGFAALLTMKQELSSGTDQMKTAATAKDYVSALSQLKTLDGNLGAFEAKKIEIEAKKLQYEQALEAVKPKLGDCGQSKFKKLEPMQQEIVTVQGQMETAAQAEDYEQALASVTDLSTKVDTYLAAVKDLEEKKKQYEEALAQVQPKLGDCGQSKFKKLEPMQQEIVTVQGQMETAAQAEDYEQALASVTDLSTKVDTYLAAVKDLEEKKKQYEDALAQVQPKLGDCGQSKFKKLESMQQEIVTVQGQMETAAQAEDYEQALTSVTDLSTKVETYLTAVKDLEEKKQQYERALEVVRPKLGDCAQSKYKKLEPMQQEIVALQTEMETAAQAEDYDVALQKVTDLTTKVEAYETAVRDLEAKKQQYEQALEVVRPKLGDCAQSKYKKLEPMQQEIVALQTEMETAAQAEDYDVALQKVTDLTTKVEAYETAVRDLEAKKQQYEQALEVVRPKLGDCAQSKYKKLEPMQQEIVALQTEMEAAAQAEDYDLALQKVTDLTAKVEAYETAVRELEAKKQQYEQALEAVRPKLGDCAQSKYKKLEPMQQEIVALQTEMETAAQAEDYDLALQKVTDLTAKVEAYETAIRELEAKKQQYEQALEGVRPKLGDCAQSKYKKLEPMQQEIVALQTEMETAAQTEDYDVALQKVTDVTTKVEAYETAIRELEAKKQQYEQALERVRPKLGDCAQSKYKKLEPMQQEIVALQTEMEGAATAEDYDIALQKVTDLTTKVEAYETAVRDLEAKKQQYEQALERVRPKLGDCAQSKYKKLEPMQQEIVALQTEMETAAQAEDYDVALQKVTDLTTKVEAYETAVRDLEAKKQQYEQALASLQPKLAEASQSKIPEVADMQKDMLAVQSQMEAAAQNSDYDQALKLLDDLKTKVDTILATKPKEEGGGTQSGGGGGGGGANAGGGTTADGKPTGGGGTTADGKPTSGGGGTTADGKLADTPTNPTPASPAKTLGPADVGKTLFGPVTHKFKDIDGPQIPETSKVKGGTKLSAEITVAVVYKGGEEGAVTSSTAGGGQVEWEPKLVPERFKKFCTVGSSRVDLQACKLEYSIVSPK